MKSTFRLALFLALGTSTFAAETAYTTPVGYTTAGGARVGYSAASGYAKDSLHPGMNLIGLRLHQSTIASGEIASLGKDYAELARSGSKPKTDLKPALVEGTTYILEITTGEKAGIIQEITRWQGNRLTLPDDIATAGVKAGDHFSLRKAATLNSVFDPRSTGLCKGENPNVADNVLIPQGASFGDFRRCFILSLPEGGAYWLDAATFKPVGDLPLVYPDGLIVQCKGTADVPMTFSGELKSGPTRSVVKPGLNLVASPFPAGGSLQDLGLENDLQKSDNPMAADKVWVAGGSFGQFSTYYLTTDNQWISGAEGEPVAGKIPVGSAILIERNGPQALFCLGEGK